MNSPFNDQVRSGHNVSSSSLLFINQTGPLKSKDDQTKVRKHVMKDIGKARRKKKMRATAAPLSDHVVAAGRRSSEYEAPLLGTGSRSIVQQTAEDLNHFKRMVDVFRGHENINFQPETIYPTRPYAVTGHRCTSQLLMYFRERFGMSIMPVDPKSMAYRLQTVWINRSLSDTCLFNATLYAASAHLDASRGLYGSQTTLFHQAEVARQIQARLTHRELATLDETIGAVIPLAFFSYVEGNLESSKVHLGGLQKMIEAKGGLDRLGFDGLLAGLVRLSFIIFAIVFDKEIVSAASIGLGELPSRPPTGLISRTVKFDDAKVCRYKLANHTRDILQDVYIISLHINKIKHDTAVSRIFRYWRCCQQNYMGAANSFADTQRLSYHEDKLQRCAELAAMVFFSIVDCNINFQWSAVARYNLLKDLQETLAETDDVMWLNSAPVAYSWVCLTGAAASTETSMRGWFYFRQGSMSRALKVDNTSLIQDAWSYFHWLKQIARSLSY